MKKILTLVCVLALSVAGCTSPSQKIAAVAVQRGMEHTSNIVYDLATEARQSAIDIGVLEVKLAVANQDEKAAVDAVEKAFNKANRIGWLQVELEKAKSYLRIGQMYIWSQQGVLDIIYRDFKKAKAAADAEDAEG